MKIISGIQQIGIGIPNVHEAWKWYRQNFGFDIPVFDDPGTAGLMLPYTGGKPHERHAILAVNIQGGGGFEIWQYTSRTPQPAAFNIQLGDLGFFAAKIKSKTLNGAFLNFKVKNENLISNIVKDPIGNQHFFVKDPTGNIFQVVDNSNFFKESKAYTGGAYGVIVGVTDIDKSKKFYADILGFDEVVYEKEGHFTDFEALPGGSGNFKRVLLRNRSPRKGPFSRFMGDSQIELVKTLDREPKKIFENRLWGDLGFIHLCFDVQGMKSVKEDCDRFGCNFTVDSNPESYEKGEGTFDMGEASGHFTYIEDPDGALIEFVETHKMPLLKKIGWYLNLKKRNPEKPLPDWMLKTMRFNRKKD